MAQDLMMYKCQIGSQLPAIIDSRADPWALSQEGRHFSGSKNQKLETQNILKLPSVQAKENILEPSAVPAEKTAMMSAGAQPSSRPDPAESALRVLGKRPGACFSLKSNTFPQEEYKGLCTNFCIVADTNQALHRDCPQRLPAVPEGKQNASAHVLSKVNRNCWLHLKQHALLDNCLSFEPTHCLQ